MDSGKTALAESALTEMAALAQIAEVTYGNGINR